MYPHGPCESAGRRCGSSCDFRVYVCRIEPLPGFSPEPKRAVSISKAVFSKTWSSTQTKWGASLPNPMPEPPKPPARDGAAIVAGVLNAAFDRKGTELRAVSVSMWPVIWPREHLADLFVIREPPCPVEPRRGSRAVST